MTTFYQMRWLSASAITPTTATIIVHDVERLIKSIANFVVSIAVISSLETPLFSHHAFAGALQHGRLVQVELDALPPDVLRDLFQEAVDRYWDTSAYERVLRREKKERATLRQAE